MHSFTCNLSNTCTCKLSNTYTFKMTNACTCKLLRITLSLHIYGWHITYGCMHACMFPHNYNHTNSDAPSSTNHPTEWKSLL